MKQWQIEYIIRFYLRLSEVLLSLGTESLFSLLVFLVTVFTGSPEGADKSSNDSKGDECGGDWVEVAAEVVEWLGASVSWVDGHVAEGIRPSRCEGGDDDT